MPSTTEIRVVQNKKDLMKFIKFPFKHYKNDTNWVPPLIIAQKDLLNRKKHPFFKHAEIEFFLAYRDKEIVGRIAAVVDDNHNEFHNEKTGFFGFFETINDFEVAEKLLTTAKKWVKDKGMKKFRGPANPSLNEDCGTLIDAFDSPPVIMMTYNPSYYPELIEKFGLKKAMDLYAYYLDGQAKKMPEKLIRVTEAIRKRKRITIRPMNIKDFANEAKKVWYIYNNAWSKNWGFVPMTEEEFDHLAKDLKQAVVPEVALMAEIDGEPVGFSLALPDLNQALIHTNGRLLPFGLPKILYYSRKIDTLRIIIMGVIHKYQKLGIDALFYIDTWKNGAKKGYTKGEMSWILENNKMMNRAATMLGGEIYKTYRLYEMNT